MSKVLTSLLLAMAVAASEAATNDLAIAREALRDGLWDVARAHAEADGSEEAKLVILESLAGEGKWKEVSGLLDGMKSMRGAGFDYYRAVVKGDHAAAMEILRKGGSPAGCAEADLFEAEALAKGGRRADAEKIWRALVAQTNVSNRVFALASANLMDADLLRRAYENSDSVALRRLTGIRLGVALLKDAKTEKEGEELVRKVVRDSPDVAGAREAFLSLADTHVAAGRWQAAFDAYHEILETWPDVSKMSAVQEGRGWVLRKLGRLDEALDAYKRMGELASDAETKARALVAAGDVLRELRRGEESMARYREVLTEYPTTAVAGELKKVVALRELEERGRGLYRSLRFADAAEVFAEVAKADPQRKPTMDFFSVLCLYGQGRDDEASALARKIVDAGEDPYVRRDAQLWLAKFHYNRRDWNEAVRLFVASADVSDDAGAAEALLWAARAAAAESDHARALQLTTRIVESYPTSKAKPRALLVQGEALLEQARFDEAVLVFERAAASEDAAPEDRVRAQLQKADALYAMGADNPARYEVALETYRAVGFGGRLSASEQIVVAFKIARVLEKLKRMGEAVDIYYSQVVLAYRTGVLAGERFSEEARADFSRAALRLADEYESHGRDRQARSVLRLLAESDVPAAGEALKRMKRISDKGRIL